MEAFGIFEGGGAKGLAHIGALKAAEEAGVTFIGLAGTSAGSIVAALVAAGYNADELFSPDNKESLFRRDFLSFFPEDDWKNLQILRSHAISAFGGKKSPFKLWLAVNWFLCKNRKRLERLTTHGGLLDTTHFETWLNNAIATKLRSEDSTFEPTGENGRVLFKDLPHPLKVISADVRTKRLRVFAMPDDAQKCVAEAVGASISIPFIFLPKSDDGQRYVDGGIVSNFPAWVFDQERKNAPPLTPTLGFRLVERKSQDAHQTEGFSLYSHLSDVFQTAVFGDNTLERREVATLHEIPLRVSIGPLDFDISDQDKDAVYRDGKNDTRDYFQQQNVWRKPESQIKGILRLVDTVIRKELGHQGHLRLNIMLPVSNSELQVVYGFNMDSEQDCDDRLAFSKGSGACGACWDSLDYVVCDLADAAETYKDTWKMSKYQQRLVRRELRSLLCVPLFDQRRIREGSEDEAILRKAFVGILNIDSDDDLVKPLRELACKDDNILATCGAMLANVLTKCA